jgi:hypothetical protein
MKALDWCGVWLGAWLALAAQAHGQALQFDGVDDFSRAEATENFPPSGSESVTIEGWFKLASYNPSGSFVVGWGSEGYYLVHFLGIQPDGDLSFSHWGADYTYDVNLALNVWHHVAAVHDGVQHRDLIYLNGQPVGATQTPALGVARTKVILGTHPNVNGYHFHGQMDEVRIWNRVRTPVEIQADLNRRLTGPLAGLVAAWSFEEGAGSSVADRSGLGHGLALNNGVAWVTSDSPVQPWLRHELLADGRLRLSWNAADGAGYQLQQAPGLDVAEGWQPVTEPPVAHETRLEVIVSPGDMAFFRLTPAAP